MTGGADTARRAFLSREPEQGPVSREVSLAGIIVALLALALGAFGPRFRWRGALWMLAIMLAAGILATLSAALQAQSAGLRFVLTPWSIASALAQQALLAFGIYGLAALTRTTLCALAAWGVRIPRQG